MTMLSCRDITKQVTDHMEGQLGGFKGLQFRLHIWFCRHCRRYLGQMRQVSALTARLRSSPPDEPPPEIVDLYRDRT